jgi:hypothetical protein
MRLITYLFAAALLWAIASSGPSTSTSAADLTAQAGRHGPDVAPQRSLSAYPK